MEKNVTERRLEIQRIVVVEDNKELTDALSAFFEERHPDKFTVVGVAGDGAEGLRLITELKPDIALIDIVLPVLDGLSILEKLGSLYLTDEVCCVMLTAVSQDDITRKAMELGAKFYFLKPFDNEALAARLLSIESDRKAKRSAKERKSVRGEQQYNKRLADATPEKFATLLLQTVGIPANLTGYYYLRRAIVLCIADETLLDALTKSLYPAIGREFKTTGQRVERSIRHSIEKAWKTDCSERYYRLLGRSIPAVAPKPSNGMFIMDFVDYYKTNR
ncbi:MAG: sporulation transcription factor Spo0A [Clostridiales bacterium]|jgi:two-component system response regulator (stage 0 sporulation protein A)|nr:sporulation transcription factor Spo0A [Clostridiales bacterium]